MSRWESAQKYKFNDYVFDQRMRVSIMKTDPTSPADTSIEVHLGFKSKDKAAVIRSYEIARKMFFESGIKGGKFYYKSDNEYIDVDIVGKEEILHPKGKSYYVRLDMKSKSAKNIREVVRPDSSGIISVDNLEYIYRTSSEITTWLPFEMELDILSPLPYFTVSLNNKQIGLRYDMQVGDVIKIRTAGGEFDVIRNRVIIAKRKYDGTPLLLTQSSNVFTFRVPEASGGPGPALDLFKVKINTKEKI